MDSFGAHTLPQISISGGPDISGNTLTILHGPSSARLDWQLDGAGAGSVTAQAAAAPAVSFTGIGSLEGGSGLDVLHGPAADTTWTVTGAGAGTVAGTGFSGFERLAGAADNQDTFLFAPGGSMAGGVDGGAGRYDTVAVVGGTAQSVVLAARDASSGTLSGDNNTIAYTGMEPATVAGDRRQLRAGHAGEQLSRLCRPAFRLVERDSGRLDKFVHWYRRVRALPRCRARALVGSCLSPRVSRIGSWTLLSESGANLELNGWDAVFAIAGNAVNAALAAQGGKLLLDFSLAPTVNVSGTYGAWQISPGGSGMLLQLQVSLTSGTYQLASGNIDLAGGEILLQVALQLLGDSSGSQDLAFDLSSNIVSLLSVTNLPSLGQIDAEALGLGIAADLSARSAEVTFVLASVSPVGTGGPTWLNPAEVAFTYAASVGGEPALCIFAVTTPQDISQLDRSIDPGLLAGGNVGLAIAPSLFMGQVFAPALAQSLGTTASSFALAGTEVLQSTGSFALPSVEKAGETYHPQINTLVATLVDDRVNVILSGSCDMHLGISLTFHGSSSIGASLGNGGVLSFSVLGTPSFTHDLEVPWYLHLLDIVTLVAELILDATTAAISNELANGISQFAQSSSITSQAPSIVGWVSGPAFTPTGAGLADCLWLQGSQPLTKTAGEIS